MASQRSKSTVTIDLTASGGDETSDMSSGDGASVASTPDFLASVAASLTATVAPTVSAEQINAHRRHLMTAGLVKPDEEPAAPAVNFGMLAESSVVQLMKIYAISVALHAQQRALFGEHTKVLPPLPAPNANELMTKNGGGSFAVLSRVTELMSAHINRVQDQTRFLSQLHQTPDL